MPPIYRRPGGRASPDPVILRRHPKWPVRAMATTDLKLQQPKPCGAGDGGRPRRHVELGQGVGDVPVNRVLADAEALGNRMVAEAARDEPEHFDFSRRQT